MRNEKSSLFPSILFEEREEIRGEDGIRFPMLIPPFPLLCILLSEIGLMRREETGGEKSLPNCHGAFYVLSPCVISCASRGITLEKMKKLEILFHLLLGSLWGSSQPDPVSLSTLERYTRPLKSILRDLLLSSFQMRVFVLASDFPLLRILSYVGD